MYEGVVNSCVSVRVCEGVYQTTGESQYNERGTLRLSNIEQVVE